MRHRRLAAICAATLALTGVPVLVGGSAPAAAATINAPVDGAQPAVTVVELDRALDVSWSHPNALRYQVRYRVAGTSKFSWAGGTSEPSRTLTGLSNGVPHDVHVRIYTASGWSRAWTKLVAIPGRQSAPDTTAPDTTAPNTTAPNTTAPNTTVPTTPPSDEPSAGGDLSVSIDGDKPATTIVVGDRSLDVSWYHPDARKYQVRYRPLGASKFQWNGGTDALSTTLNGLINGRDYDVQVRIYTAAGWARAWSALTAAPGTSTVPPTTAPPTTAPPTTAPPTTAPPTTTAPPHQPGAWVKASDERATYSDPSVAEKYFAFDPYAMNDPTWGITRMGFLVRCDSVKFDRIDPIVAPGAAASMHLHEFFGNPNVTPHTTTQSLADTPRSQIACTDLNDKSAYWVPAVYQNGRRVTANQFSMYYKTPSGFEEPIPFGLRMIAGNAKATKNQPSHVGWWELPGGVNPTFDATEMLESGEGGRLMLRLNFPQCWDGVHLDSPDHQSHMAYSIDTTTAENHFFGTELRPEDGNGCPASHPVRIPQLTMFTRYDVAGGSGLSLSSGEWFTFHMDFWNAWDPGYLERLIDACGAQDRVMCRLNSTPRLTKLGQHAIWVR